jgi:indole-3-pyruvate monooxygenase
MQTDDILVVGAGPAGLAISACLHHEALTHVVLEREAQVADSWHRHYDRLHLHTTKSQSGLPLTAWPKAVPRYASREHVAQYLKAYAAEHDIAPRLGVVVHAVERRGNRFRVDTSAGLMTPRIVVVATGYNSVPKLPSISGLDSFDGPRAHSSKYKNAVPYRDKRTLVVGCGNSGAEIALDLAEHGVDVAMVVRNPVHVIPRDLLGRPTQHTSILLSYLPLGLRDVIAMAIMRPVVGDLSRFGIKRPAVGPNRMIQESGRFPILDIGTIAMVKQGRIRILPAVHEIASSQVRFIDGAQHPFDAIIFATGYTSGLGQLIKGFEKLADARGRPRHCGEQTDIPGLYFVGFKNPATGALREIALEAPRVARAIRMSLNAADATFS